MKILFGSNTLADIAASPKLAAQVEHWPGTAQVQTWERYNAPRGQRPVGNFGDQFAFKVFSSQDTYNHVIAAYTAALALVGTTADLVITPVTGSTTITFAAAILRSAVPVIAGKGIELRYTFEINSVTSP